MSSATLICHPCIYPMSNQELYISDNVTDPGHYRCCFNLKEIRFHILSDKYLYKKLLWGIV